MEHYLVHANYMHAWCPVTYYGSNAIRTSSCLISSYEDPVSRLAFRWGVQWLNLILTIGSEMYAWWKTYSKICSTDLDAARSIAWESIPAQRQVFLHNTPPSHAACPQTFEFWGLEIAQDNDISVLEVIEGNVLCQATDHSPGFWQKFQRTVTRWVSDVIATATIANTFLSHIYLLYVEVICIRMLWHQQGHDGMHDKKIPTQPFQWTQCVQLEYPALKCPPLTLLQGGF